MQRFTGRTALVTGGAAGIGHGVVQRLVEEGAQVSVWDVQPDKLAACQATWGERVLPQRVDVTDLQAVCAAHAAAVQHWGAVDIVVNAAGIVGPNGPFEAVEPAAWERVLRTNLTGSFWVMQAVVGGMRERGWGRIVNVASIAALEGSAYLAPYAASKAGLIALTKSVGKELAATGVLVNAIAPALIATEMIEHLTPEYLAASLAKIPMGRPGTLAEVAALVAWLCSSECAFSTGAVYDLSGGRA
jgi:NAD(P)-dependent dehydrogenase (short-subunit alcohol dehydrogenase family)